MCEGIAAELDGLRLGDERLNRRAKKLIAALAADSQASVNSVCDGWADTQAAYRFFDNPRTTPDKILTPHYHATLERVRRLAVALIPQDTTEFDLTKHPPKDARCLDKSYRFGFYDHMSLAISPDRLCLGLVGDEQFDRSPESLGRADERSNLPIEEKESFRWLEGYRLACRIAAECPATRIVSMADREGDLYDTFVEHREREGGPRAEFLIRSRMDRSLPERDPEAGPAVFLKVQDEILKAPSLGTRTIELQETPKRAARVATLEIRAMTATLKPPHARSRMPNVTLQVVLAEEIDAPDEETKVRWLLYTSLAAATLEESLAVLDYYTARWTIEEYFRVLKTGCKVEEIQLEKSSRLKNCLAFYKIIAARTLYLTHLNRRQPDSPVGSVFAAEEWKSVWSVVNKEPPPRREPTLDEFMRLLTRLGGYNNRPSEPPPGPQTVWIGLRRMLDFASAWLAFGPDVRQDVCK